MMSFSICCVFTDSDPFTKSDPFAVASSAPSFDPFNENDIFGSPDHSDPFKASDSVFDFSANNFSQYQSGPSDPFSVEDSFSGL